MLSRFTQRSASGLRRQAINARCLQLRGFCRSAIASHDKPEAGGEVYGTRLSETSMRDDDYQFATKTPLQRQALGLEPDKPTEEGLLMSRMLDDPQIANLSRSAELDRS